MDFKKMFSKSFLPILIIGIVLAGLLFWKFTSKTEAPDQLTNTDQPVVQPVVPKEQGARVVPATKMASEVSQDSDDQDDQAIQEQIDRDRQEQKETKDLKNKLELTDLELQQEKAISELNKLKKENLGAFNESTEDAQSNTPEVKVEYIGGNDSKKEAIISIGGTDYQVKKQSRPTDSIQVMAISDSSVTLHFDAPVNITKTIDYKPE